MISALLKRQGLEPFPSQAFPSGSAFLEKRAELGRELKLRSDRELGLVNGDAPIRLSGRCTLCRRDVVFTADWEFARTLADGRRVPRWRERLICSGCKMNNRLRASLHFMQSCCGLNGSSKVYLTEQTTPFFRLMRKFASVVVGSEYLTDGTARGATNARGFRNEDITQLTFESDQFDIIGSFDVLEHVPDYKAGLREIGRVLKPGGHFVLTVPFRMDLHNTLVRARINEDGSIEHLHPAEYHGDPLSDRGVLCYYHFGWDLLDDMRAAGFSDASCHLYWSWELGYLGGAGILFHAIK